MKLVPITILLALYSVGYALHVAPLPVTLPEQPTKAEVCEYVKKRPMNFTNLPSLDALRKECAGVGVAI